MATRQKEVVDEALSDDDLWNDLVTENAVPPLKIKGHLLYQPTKERVDKWRASSDPVEGERALLGDQYDLIHGLFDQLPQSAWQNFNKKYLSHMFGVGESDDLKG